MPIADLDDVLEWLEHELRPLAAQPAAAVLAADSWLVADGAVRGYDLHWARFAGSCTELGVPADEVVRFREAVTAALPRSGRLFPRVELVGDTRLLLRVRQAAALREVRVIVGTRGDPRTQPRRKGPDLELLAGLRAQALAAGGDQLLLRDDDGRLVEGALDSLLWWQDDVLCTTPDARTLPGVTRALLLAIARDRGIETRVSSPRAEQLATCETWLTNALHGIRVVTSWDGAPAAPAPRVACWRAALEAAAEPLPEARWSRRDG